MSRLNTLTIDPLQAAQQRRTFKGTLSLTDCRRLQDIIVQDSELWVHYDITFGFDEEERGRICIKGRIEACLSLMCERCHCPVAVTIDVSPCLSPVMTSELAVHLPKAYDPWVTQGQPIELVELIEEEILLSLPMVAKHPVGECPVDLPNYLN